MVSISQAAWDGLVSENVGLKARLAEAEKEFTQDRRDLMDELTSVVERLGKSEDLLREAREAVEFYDGNFCSDGPKLLPRIDAFLAADSASACQHDIRKPRATWSAASPSRCVVCGESWEADQPTERVR